MYGALQGIRAGVDDGMRIREREAQEAYRAQLLAMKQAQERRAQQEFDARQAYRQRITSAIDNVQSLYNQDARVRAGDITGETGIPMPRPVDDRDYLRAYSQLSLAKGDVGAADQFRTKGKMLDVADLAKQKAADPEFQRKVFDFVHKDNRFLGKFTDAVIDPKTGKVVTPAKFDLEGGGQIQLSEQDKYQFAYGAALMQSGMTDEGMKVIAGVNKELAAMVAKANQTMVGAAEVNRKAQNDALDNNAKIDQQEAMKEYRASLRRGSGAGGPRMDPKLLAEYNDLQARYENAMTTGNQAEAAALRQQLVVKRAQLFTNAGKVAPLSDGPRTATTDITPAKRLELAAKIMETTPGLSLQGAMEQVDALVGGGGAGPGGGSTADQRFLAALKQMQAEKEAKKAQPAQAIPSAPRGALPADAVSAAEAELSAAKQALQRYGLRQRQADPAGFAAAQQAILAAQAKRDAALDAWMGQQHQQPGAAFRYPTP